MCVCILIQFLKSFTLIIKTNIPDITVKTNKHCFSQTLEVKTFQQFNLMLKRNDFNLLLSIAITKKLSNL